jgi:RimJ/RimL family protein N-acetyltransferase
MIDTDRLVLRDWRESDLAPWAAMNADPAVREHLGPLLTPAQAEDSVRRFQGDRQPLMTTRACASLTAAARVSVS